MTRPLLGYLGSFAYDRKADAKLTAYIAEGVPVLMDSGAFSVVQGTMTIDVHEHAEWARTLMDRWPSADLRCFALDVIGDPKQTVKNYDIGRAVEPSLVPTIHFGTDPAIVTEYLDRGADLVGLGGMVPYLKPSTVDKVIRWSAAVIQRTREAGARTHALGATLPPFVKALPVESVDSTYWLNPCRFGYQAMFDPTIGDWRKIKSRSRDAYRYRTLLTDVYDLDPAHVDANGQDCGYDLPIWVSLRSHEQFARYGRDRHDNEFTVFVAGSNPPLPLPPVPPPTKETT